MHIQWPLKKNSVPHLRKIRFFYKIVVVVTTQSQLTIKPTVMSTIVLYQLINKYYVVPFDTFSSTNFERQWVFVNRRAYANEFVVCTKSRVIFMWDSYKNNDDTGWLFVCIWWLGLLWNTRLLVTFTHFCFIKIFQKVCNIKTKQDYTD